MFWNKKFLYLLSALLSLALPSLAFAETGLGSIASNILEPVSIFSDFVSTACFVLGGSFLFISVIKYVEHKRSPLMVPISTVVFLVVAGILLIALPFLAFYIETGIRPTLLST